MPAASMRIRLRPSAARMGRALGELGQDLTDFKPVFRQMLPMLARGIEDNFRRAGRPIDSKWALLSKSRIRQKRKAGQPLDMLVATGALAAELSSPSRMKRSLTKTRIVVGPRTKIAYLHHFGGGKSNLPERRFIAMSSRMRDQAFEAMIDYNRRLVAEAASRIRAAGGSDG